MVKLPRAALALLFVALATAAPSYFPDTTPVSWVAATQAQNQTLYDAVGVSGNATNAIAMAAPIPATLRNLRVAVTSAPAAGQTYTFTIYTGSTLGSLTASSVTCQMSNPATTCADSTHTAALTAGQYWLMQVVTSATSGSTGQKSYSLQIDGK